MNLRPLVLDDDARAKIRTLREAAEAAPMVMAEVAQRLQTPEGQEAHMLDMAGRTIVLGFGTTVTFSTEDHDGRMFRHLSMAVAESGKLPNPEAVRFIIPEFGFVGVMERDCHIYIEDMPDGHHAINVVQPLDHVPPPLD